MARGNPVKWVFDGSKLDRATVKRRVLEAMREPGFRREVDRLLLDNDVAGVNFQNILGKKIDDSKNLIEALADDNGFDIIFEIAE